MSKTLGTIFNNDCSNIIYALDGANSSPADYSRIVDVLLDRQPGVLAQDVGQPDPVLFRSEVATTFDKYFGQVSHGNAHSADSSRGQRWEALLQRFYAENTDPLQITIDACRQRGITVLASFRMNAEDWYEKAYLLSDFGRAHPQHRIRKPDGQYTGALDYAIPEVFDHRLKIFTEVAENYDIDGIEFDFRRWYHMISDPLKNHPVLTRLLRQTRKMLDDVAAKKGRPRMILGARVGPSLDSDPSPYIFPGIYFAEKPVNSSCRELGLDVKTWIADGSVDYLCPALFLDSLPAIPLVHEFAELAKGTNVGIYPTLWPLASWMHGVCERSVDFDDTQAMALYKHDLCDAALKMYAQGADGISTFNWYSHLRDAKVPNFTAERAGPGADAIQTHVYPLLKSPESIREYLAQPWAIPRALTSFVNNFHISSPLSPQDDLTLLEYPQELDLTPRVFAGDPGFSLFCDVRADLRTAGLSDALLYWRCCVHCAETMKLAALLGYDGPVKLWIDGQEKFCDAAGSNPARVDKAAINFDAAPGTHEVLIAFSANPMKAWGIFLRFERIDLSQQTIAAGLDSGRLPIIGV